MTVEWRPLDYADKAATAPPPGMLVWVNERYYAEGVDLGYFDGFTMRVWSGSDDCSVTYWAPIERPPRRLRCQREAVAAAAALAGPVV